MGQQCYGGVCGTLPPECTDADGGAGSKCGQVPNACGSGNVNCGGCEGTTTCTGGTCTTCNPPTCGSTTCGQVSNGCGPKVTCGTCGSSEQVLRRRLLHAEHLRRCGGRGPRDGLRPRRPRVRRAAGVRSCGSGDVCRTDACCTPLTCAGAVDAGLVTGCNAGGPRVRRPEVVPDVPAGEVCQGDRACSARPRRARTSATPDATTTTDAARPHQTAAGPARRASESLCCHPGDVVYEGSCCVPQCDPSLPPGPQRAAAGHLLRLGLAVTGPSKPRSRTTVGHEPCRGRRRLGTERGDEARSV